jgi:hypothetical protein
VTGMQVTRPPRGSSQTTVTPQQQSSEPRTTAARAQTLDSPPRAAPDASHYGAMGNGRPPHNRSVSNSSSKEPESGESAPRVPAPSICATLSPPVRSATTPPTPSSQIYSLVSYQRRRSQSQLRRRTRRLVQQRPSFGRFVAPTLPFSPFFSRLGLATRSARIDRVAL